MGFPRFPWMLPGDISKRGEYTLVSEYFATEPISAKVCVDVGAFGKKHSNTWNFIANGWRGLLIEPLLDRVRMIQRQFVGDFQVVRSAVSDYTGEATFYLSRWAGVDSLEPNWRPAGHRGQLTVPVRPLVDILREHPEIPEHFGLLSVDTEGHDERVIRPLLENSPYRPDVLIVERPEPTQPGLPWADLLEAHGYTLRNTLADNYIWTRTK